MPYPDRVFTAATGAQISRDFPHRFVLETALMQWLNKPPVWQADEGRLRVVTGLKTDFWRVTHYGFIRDNGHFYYEQRAGDFTIHVKIEGNSGAV